MPTKTELIERAYGAWLKYRRGRGSPPTLSASTVETYEGRTYVVLRRGDQVVDIYRYMPETENTRDSFKRLMRYYPGPYGRQRAAA